MPPSLILSPLIPPALGQSALQSRLTEQLSVRRSANRYRVRSPIEVLDSTHVSVDGVSLVNFAGNDYLGLSHHPRLQVAASTKKWQPSGSSASALVTGYSLAHASAEARIARWKHTEAAVLLPSGYQANHAAIQTLTALGGSGGDTVRFLIDKLSHASLLDAVRGSGCPFRVFPHNGMAKLARLLEAAPRNQLQVVVTESIFSMDGDDADLQSLATLREQFGFVLLLDEAHGSGVYGTFGSGFASERNLSTAVDVSVCTFSKAAGLIGGAICASKQFCEAVVNFGRAYIYSTAVPPLLASQIELSIDLMASEPSRQERVRSLSKQMRKSLAEMGVTVPPGDSPIIPLVVGSEIESIDLSKKLRARGILVPAIRPPTVAPKASRLRMTLSCEHTDKQIQFLTMTLRDVLQT